MNSNISKIISFILAIIVLLLVGVIVYLKMNSKTFSGSREVISATYEATDKAQDVNNYKPSVKYKIKTVTRGENIIVNKNHTPNIKIEDSDKSVVNYLREKYEYISNNSNLSKETLKKSFTEVVDFIFYGGTIKGKTFKELSEQGKLEVIKLAIKIESKIDEWQPGLIDSLDDKYKNAKTKIVNLYTEKTNEFCSNHPDNCEYFREDYNQMKKSFSNAFNVIKEAGKKIGSKVSDLYEDYKNS